MSRIYRCTYRCTYADGTLCQPGVHFQTDVPTAGSEPDPADVAAGVWGLTGGDFLSACPSFVTVHELVVAEQVLKPDIGAAGAHTVDQAGSLAVGQEDLPRELVALINLHTDTASRSARGYVTMPGVGSETFTNDRLWTSVYMTQLGFFAARLSQSFSLGTLQVTHVNPVVYSRTRHQRATEPFAFRVKDARANPRPHWRRSRGTTP